jgi:DNA-binding beta-propeller fold protein YncE
MLATYPSWSRRSHPGAPVVCENAAATNPIQRIRVALVAFAASSVLLGLASAGAAAAGSAYVNDLGVPTVAQLNIDAVGLLSPKTPATVAGPGGGLFSIVASPDGKSVYAIGGSVVSEFDVKAGGLLMPKNPATVAAGSSPRGIAISPDGSSAYVADVADSVIWQYTVGTGGVLSPKLPASIVAGSMAHPPYVIAISPDGKSLYATQHGNTLLQFDIGAGGLLSPKNPAAVPAGPLDVSNSNESGIAVTPDGKSVYVANLQAAQVWQYDVGAGGGLLSKSVATVNQAAPVAIAVTPDGRSVYVTSQGGSLSQYTVGAGELLTPKTPATVGAGASMTNPDGVAIAPDGKSAYVANCGDPFCTGGSVLQYQIGAGGLLSPFTPTAVAAGMHPDAITVLPDQGPTASFSSTTASAGSAAHFDGSGSNDPDGAVARYDWQFGDGAQAANAGPKPTHVYGRAGSYNVRLTVTDNGGCSTAFVFTGQTASCNGGPAATTVRAITIGSPPRPVIRHVTESHRRWREGGKGSRKLPVGTSFSFRLNGPASVALTFTRKHKRKAAATLVFAGHAGLDKLPFKGRISRRHKLAPGSYTVSIVATNAIGQRSPPSRLKFTIVS